MSAASRGRRAPKALDRVASWLEEELGDDLPAALDCPESAMISPSTLKSIYRDLEDEEVWEALHVEDGARVTPEQRLAVFEHHSDLLRGIEGDGDLTTTFYPVELTSTDGRQAVILLGLSGYSFSTTFTADWVGPYPSEEAFYRYLRAEGWIATVEEYLALPIERRLDIVGARQLAR